MDWCLVGVKGDPRIQGFQAALNQFKYRSRVINYEDNWESSLQTIRRGQVVRVDSPAWSYQTLRHLMHIGEEALPELYKPYSSARIRLARLEQGELFAPHQLFYGLYEQLRQLETICKSVEAYPLFSAQAYHSFYDKALCHQVLNKAALPTPATFPMSIQSYEELRHYMRDYAWKRVFIKPQFGSGGSGVIALEVKGSQLKAQSTTYYESKRLWNSQRVHTIRDESVLETIINQLVPWGIHVERWIPKAQIQGHSVDLRVLVIAGEPCFFVLRKSKTPITNLHLLNQRDVVDALKQRMSDTVWQALLDTCREVGRLFPMVYQIGIDIAVHSNFQKHSILEINAFGDFLKGITHQGLTPYQWQIKHIQNWLTCEP